MELATLLSINTQKFKWVDIYYSHQHSEQRVVKQDEAELRDGQRQVYELCWFVNQG